ncbi:hypothetical protein EXM22_02510 [Oceanispirochaeta crateris]|uniref:Uncharacterized protein n=1 Tax=Oceanispirochaeta crateris TaxID=2518645 RepID=A0A5C1QIE2_9SPIO|nr:hypothetical protein [Oceanispirochaeta crateris]QEN06919.1 hypothetical protein EXM22_02510 [Oceanispirochaeta crateris]
MKKQFVVLLLLILSVSFLTAGETQHQTSWGVDFAYYLDDNKGKNSDNGFAWPSYSPVEVPDTYPIGSDEGRELGSGWGSVELQLYIDHTITVPFLQGTSPLTKDNNIKFGFRGSLAPVVAYVQTKAVITPIAFLNFELGYSIGSGWSGLGFNGIGLNNDGTGIPESDPFPGAVMETWMSGTFQFDMAAVRPGKWNHVVVVANGKFKNMYFTAAGSDDAWQWKADDGENFNGNMFLGTYVLGYQMPLQVDMIGFMVETEQYIGDVKDKSTMASNGWGSDFVEVKFGPLANVTFDEKNSVTALLQFKTDRLYSDDSIHDNYYATRNYESTYVKIHRIALAYKHKF